MKFADVTNDIAFKKIFGDEHKKVVLISFLNAVLDLEEDHKIVDVTILNPYQLPIFRDGKATIIDVKARDQNNRYYMVEMQVANAEGFSKRVLYYTSHGYVSQIERGEFYNQLNPTVFIGILEFEMSQNTKYLSRHRIQEVETGERIFRDMEFNLIELPKFKLKREELNTMLDKWIFFLKEAESLEIIPDEMDDPGLQTAFISANIQTWSKAEMEAYNYAGMRETEDRLRIQKALNTGLEEGLKKGVELGMEKGMEQGMEKGLELGMEKGLELGFLQNAQHIAKKMKEMGLLLPVISEATGLPIEMLEKL